MTQMAMMDLKGLCPVCCDSTCHFGCDLVPALACDAPRQGIILLRWHANAGIESQVESQVMTQVQGDTDLNGPLFLNVIRLQFFP
jgi:hypothetical protein